jgi:hypothetical protein
MPRVFSSAPAAALSLLLLIVLGGCGSSGDGYSGPRGTVTGTVKIDGKPLQAGCQVLFMSDKGITATGTLDEQGNYKLVYAHGDVPAVDYLVQLTAPAATAVPNQDPLKMAGNVKLSKKGSEGKRDLPFPPRFSSTQSSKMSFTVKAGENKANFELTSK